MNQIDFAAMLTGDALLAKVREIPQIVESMNAWLDGQSPALRGVANDLIDQGYPLCDIRDFVEEFGSEAFVTGHYETWCELSTSFANDAVDEFVEEFGINAIDDFEQSYSGQYGSEAEFAEHYYTEIVGADVPEGLVVDWDATWENGLGDLYTYTESGYVFDNGSVG